jgi:ATP-dependent Clp protease protease subunit
MINYAQEFEDYAIKHMGISQHNFAHWATVQSRLYGPSASLTPYILEERQLRVTQMDIFSRMMMDRIIWLAGPVNDMMSTVVQAQLMFLDTLDQKDITLHIDSPGGSVKSGLSIIDVMDYVASDISTINTGMAASMGSVLLGAGTKGKRFTLKNSRVMLHQVSAYAGGNIQDMRITFEQTEKYNKLLFDMLGSYSDKTGEQVMIDAKRDLWMDSDQVVDYGLVDSIITSRQKNVKITRK